MGINEFDVPEEINVHEQIWGKIQIKLLSSCFKQIIITPILEINSLKVSLFV
jgi:hypothetical protein